MPKDILLDLERERRIGFDEAIYSAGKSTVQLESIVAASIEGATRRLFTRLHPAQVAALAERFQRLIDYDPVSRTGVVGARVQTEALPRIAIVTAGSSDSPVGREAARTLEYYGRSVLEVDDVGVAGLWRLMARLDEIRAMEAVIVISGMEGALPSVVGGLVASPVIAVPTSVGYGVSEGGHAALSSALASCAPGVVVVNIDNGYGAACAVLRLLGARHPHGHG